jgi:hypothetical protein
MSTWIVRVVVISQGRYGLGHHGLAKFGNQFVNSLEILLGESLLFEKATPSGNEPSSTG